MGRMLSGRVEAVEFSPGTEVTGVYIRQKEVPIKGRVKPSMMYHFRAVESGEIFGVWGCAALDSAMEQAAYGMVLRVKRVKDGKAKSGQSAPKMFQVEVLEEAKAAE